MQAFKAGLASALASREESLRAGMRCPWCMLGLVVNCSVAQGNLQVLHVLYLMAQAVYTDVGMKAAAVDGETATTTSGLRELTCDDFHSFIEESNNAGRLVLVDFYTDW